MPQMHGVMGQGHSLTIVCHVEVKATEDLQLKELALGQQNLPNNLKTAARRVRRVRWEKDWEEEGRNKRMEGKIKLLVPSSSQGYLSTFHYPGHPPWKALLPGTHSLGHFRGAKSHANLSNTLCFNPLFYYLSLKVLGPFSHLGHSMEGV